MSAGLIKHLRKKTDEDSNTKILMSQWEFDEKLVGKSLENVGSYYPHFSSHNESHSQQILVNIERLLGSNIEKLTATDTWLILEAAYWHDIGMLFNADEVQKVFEEDDFKEYVESLANDNTQDLHEFAKVWHEHGWNKALVNHSDPHTGVEKYRQMIAEWYRRGHAKNSNSVVLDPFEKLGISSPRTELLPKRIYRYLGQICWAHGLGFDDYVMKTLPFRQTGMGTENCHPRFVACLLRLGDLFDIDDNRFCPVMARQVGNMPSFSETHTHKHQAIREFQLDNETVSITAICSTEMAYIECRNWFDWIKEEIQNQMSQWKNIVPHRDFGLLPTINKLDVEMTDKKILLNDKPMKFSLDERSAIELLQGNNLYKDDMSIYRELIQNAIDATMIRVWLEHGQDYSSKKLSKNANPYDVETRELFADYPITLDCNKIADNEDSTLWEFSIEDNGVGISRTDLEYMQKIAGSKNNKEKQKIIRQMPTWMRPSGEFGIGLHSAFLLMKDLPTEQQKITILTKSRLTHESLKIELNSPLSGKAGYCFIEEIDDLNHYGTKLTVTKSLNNDIVESQIYKPKTYFLYQNYSPILQTLENIYKKATNKTINLIYPDFFVELENYLSQSFDMPKDESYRRAYWCDKTQALLKIKIDDSEDIENFKAYNRKFPKQNNLAVFFRGQFITYFKNNKAITFTNGINELPFFKFSIDIYSENATSLLELSRDNIKDGEKVISILQNTFLKFLEEVSEGTFDALPMLDNSKVKLSLLTKLLENKILNYTDDQEWKSFKIHDDLTIKDILDKDRFTSYSGFSIVLKEAEGNEFLDQSQIINSPLLSRLVKNYRFRTILSEYSFKTYIYSNSQKSGSHQGQYLFSKTPINNNHFKEIDTPHHLNLITLSSLLRFDEESYSIKLALEDIDYSFFPMKNIKAFEDIFIEIDKMKYFIFPFIRVRKSIIEVRTDEIFNLYKDYLSTSITYDRFEVLYLEFKSYVISRAEESYPTWCQAFKRGIEFKAIELKF